MKRAQAIAGIAVLFLLAACAVAPGHAAPRGAATGRPSPPSTSQAGARTGLDVPCAQTLLVPVTARHPRPGQPRTVYRRRPCWCGS
jgi:hypothetical protein